MLGLSLRAKHFTPQQQTFRTSVEHIFVLQPQSRQTVEKSRKIQRVKRLKQALPLGQNIFEEGEQTRRGFLQQAS